LNPDESLRRKKATALVRTDRGIGGTTWQPTLRRERNLGSVQNSGLELTVNTTILDTRSLGWDLTVAASHNTNKILSLGVDAQGKSNPTIGTGGTRDSIGLPVNAYFYRPFTYSDANGAATSHPARSRSAQRRVSRVLAAARPRLVPEASTCSAGSCGSRR
jgi:hypothetical protein